MDLRWLLVILMSLIVIAVIWRDMNGMGNMPWTKCKESLFTQVTTGSAHCALRQIQFHPNYKVLYTHNRYFLLVGNIFYGKNEKKIHIADETMSDLQQTI